MTSQSEKQSGAIRRALANPIVPILVGGLSFWGPYALWFLMPDSFIGDRSGGSLSFIVLAPGAVWAAMYCWYRFMLPRAEWAAGPAIKLGIVGPLTVSWIGTWVVLLVNEIRGGKPISVGRLFEAGLEAPFDFLPHAAAVGMLIPHVVVVIGSRFVGRVLSRMADDTSVMRASFLEVRALIRFVKSALNVRRDVPITSQGWFLVLVAAALLAVAGAACIWVLGDDGVLIVIVIAIMLTWTIGPILLFSWSFDFILGPHPKVEDMIGLAFCAGLLAPGGLLGHGGGLPMPAGLALVLSLLFSLLGNAEGLGLFLVNSVPVLIIGGICAAFGLRRVQAKAAGGAEASASVEGEITDGS